MGVFLDDAVPDLVEAYCVEDTLPGVCIVPAVMGYWRLL